MHAEFPDTELVRQLSMMGILPLAGAMSGIPMGQAHDAPDLADANAFATADNVQALEKLRIAT